MIPVVFTPCRGEHLKLIRPADVQADEYAPLTSPGAIATIEATLSFTAWRAGVCLGAGGLVPHWPGRAEAWLLVDRRAGPHFRQLVRFMRTALDNTPHRRVEMTVIVDNDIGHRIASLLGFEYEAVLEAYHPNGSNVAMYKRVRP